MSITFTEDISGSLNITGSIILYSGTLSPMPIVESASYATTASTSSYSQYAATADYATSTHIADTASYATTASYAINGGGGSSISSSWASSSLSASYAITASYVANLLETSSYALQALSASYAMNGGGSSISSSWASASLSSSFISGGVVVIGLPTDGQYGGSAGNISGIAAGDIVEDGLDKIEIILGKLAPAKPANLNTRTLTTSAAIYSALSASVGGAVSKVTVTTQPQVGWTFAAGTSGSTTTLTFDGDSGIVSSEIDGVTLDTHTMTTSSDVGTYGSLVIVQDSDPYNGTFGSQGFWKGFIAKVVPTAPLGLSAHSARLLSSVGGNTPVYTFSIDNPSTPSISNLSGSVTSTPTRYVSGVPSLGAGDTVRLYFTSSNVVSQFYNSTRINSVGSSVAAATVNDGLPPSAPPSMSLISSSIQLTIASGQYIAASTYTATAYNSAGTTGASTWTPAVPIRVDTNSIETARVKSGIGQYPTLDASVSGAGAVFTASAHLSGSKELQMINNSYQYPPAINYTTNSPIAGPNYTALTPDIFGSEQDRWATFISNITAASNITVTFNGSANFTGVATTGSMRVYVRVSGSLPTTGWIDGSTAYPGVGNPTNNGDAALVAGSSTTTAKVVTFGTSPKTGTVFVRVGIPSASLAGSNRTFTGITIS